MYGVFITFTYPTANYEAPPPSWGPANSYNETEFFTDEAMTSSFAFGLRMRYTAEGQQYQPYWLEYTPSYRFHPVGEPMTETDGRLHTFMAIPHCDTCNTWDIFYDFELVGTTEEQPTGRSHHLITGWTLPDMFGPVGIGATSNRIMYLTGNKQFRRFSLSDTRTRVPDGNCDPGADPDYCWRFDTSVVTKPGTSGKYVVSWDVEKPIVKPGSTSDSQVPSPMGASVTAEDLERRAQAFVDSRYRGGE
ncbi:hypothetical protein [Saccharomonospora iraqiensis]|uniref:hypothetical protein n=1 Tax=Saccharomonospora iraqiensis TaxID=52698 RepID=UPI00022E82C8|nr:hypothetical protein [Saccharomonospora iraqiensis]